MNANMAYGFTETELDIAKHTDLPDLLSSLGYTLKRIGSYYTTCWPITGGPETPPTGTSPSPAPSRLRPKKSRPSSCLPRTRTSAGCLRIFASGELRLR